MERSSNRSAGYGPQALLWKETHPGIRDAKKRVCMSNQKKQSTLKRRCERSIGEADGSSLPKKRPGSSSTGSEAKRASRIYADKKASPRTSTTDGTRIFPRPGRGS